MQIHKDMIGWRLENVVYIELLRRCAYDFYDVYYYKSAPRAKEIDFVVCDKSRAVELIQVAYEIDSPRAYDRETSSLVKASDALSCDRLTLIAFTQTRDVEIDGKTIHIISALDWLLRYGTENPEQREQSEACLNFAES